MRLAEGARIAVIGAGPSDIVAARGDIEALRAFGWEAAAAEVSAAASAGSRSCRQRTIGALHAQE